MILFRFKDSNSFEVSVNSVSAAGSHNSRIYLSSVKMNNVTSIFFSGLDLSAATTPPTHFTKQSSSRIKCPAPTEPGRAQHLLQDTSHHIKVPKKPGKFCPLDNFSLSKYGPDQIYSPWRSCSCSGKTR